MVEEAHARGVLVKVIFETCELDEASIRAGVDACVDAGADFVKTSTGFAAKGATPEAVRAMLSQSAGRIRVKASGGIRTINDARGYVEMGVERLGVAFPPPPPSWRRRGKANKTRRPGRAPGTRPFERSGASHACPDDFCAVQTTEARYVSDS